MFMVIIIDDDRSRICVPASDAIDGRLGNGVEELLGLRSGA